MSSVARVVRLVAALVVLAGIPVAVAEVAGPTASDPAIREQSEESVARDSPRATVDVTDDREALLAAGRAVDAGGLQPGLAAALEAARAAAGGAPELPVASAYRSAEEQLATLEAEIAERGSVDDALRWVFLPADSMHVRGLAIDIGSGPAADWLQTHGARFGLCKTLAWEWWHFEWRQEWQDRRACPPPATSLGEVG